MAAIFDAHLTRGYEPEIGLRRIDVLIDVGDHAAAQEEILRFKQNVSYEAYLPSIEYFEGVTLAALGEDEEGWKQYREGLRAARDAANLVPYYDDIEPLLPASDQEAWPGWPVERQREFIEGWWNARDPLPLSPVNERWIEQQRRIRFVRQTFQFKKAWGLERLVALEGSDVGLPTLGIRLDGRPMDDRAKLYLRHGEPDARGGVGRDECGFWYYNRPGLPGESFGVNFRQPGGTGEQAVFAGNDCVYSRLPTTPAGMAYFAPGGIEPWDRIRVEQETQTELGVALSSDSHPFPLEAPIEIDADPASFAFFRNATDLVVYFAVPLSEIAGEDGRARYRKGLVVYDARWREVARHTEEMEVVLRREPTAGRGEPFLVDLFRVRIRPGTYHVAVQVDDRRRAGIGVWKGELEARAFGPGLGLSDVVLAATVEFGRHNPRFERYGHIVMPLPSRAFVRGQPAFLYYEVYNLQPDATGRAAFRVDYTVHSERSDEGAVRRLFGALEGLLGVRGETDAVTVSFERVAEAGESAVSPEYVSLDTAALAPGAYVLDVTVTDGAGRQASRQEHFTIVD